MFKFFKNLKSPIKVKCYTIIAGGLHKAYPPQVSSQPSWAKQIKSFSVIETARELLKPERDRRATRTIKTCPGRVELYQKGFILPLWSDLYLYLDGEKNWKYQFADMKSTISNHTHSQYSTLFDEDEYLHLKLDSPWVMYTEEDVDFVAIKPAWEVKPLDGLEILPGILTFHHQHSNNVNMFIKFPEKKEEKREIILRAGTPIYHFIPLSDRKVELEVKAVSHTDPEFIDAFRTANHSFSRNSYRHHIKVDK